MEQQTHKDTDEARAGSTPHVVRYVLAISLLLALATMMIVYIWGNASTADPADDASAVAATEQAQP